MRTQGICVFRLVLGYAYPAYECFKTVELNKPEIEQLRFWCQYWYVLVTCRMKDFIFQFYLASSYLWLKEKLLILIPFFRILVAALTIFERVGESFISW